VRGNEVHFLNELQHHPPDVILFRYGFPTFDGFTALVSPGNTRPDVPFIFVTGALGEEVTITSFESGATDYVLKDHLRIWCRHPNALWRVAEERRARKQLERSVDKLIEELKESLTQIRTLVVLRSVLCAERS